MLYKKIKIECEGAEDRLFRILQVRSDIDLLTLGYIILTSFQAEFSSPYVIEDNDIWYVLDTVLENEDIGYMEGKELRSLSEYHLKDLPDQFNVKYFDNEEPYIESPELGYLPWTFTCKADKKELGVANDLYAYMLDGKGVGIWEDQREAYFDYLKGKIDPDADYDVDEAWIPANLDIETYGETDSAFDLEMEKEDFESDMYPEYVKAQVQMAVEMMEFDDDYGSEEYFDEWDDYDEADDLDEFLSYMTPENLTKSVMTISMFTTMSILQTSEFVADKFSELCEKYDSADALLMISETIAASLQKFLSGELLENDPEFRKKIKKLK